AWWMALASLVTAEMARTRATGSSMSVARDVNMFDTALPLRRRPSPPGIATGTPATNARSGTPPWSARYWRRAPAHTASTTSFTVTPNAFLTAFTSSSGSVAIANHRWGVSAPLNGVLGPANG